MASIVWGQVTKSTQIKNKCGITVTIQGATKETPVVKSKSLRVKGKAQRSGETQCLESGKETAGVFFTPEWCQAKQTGQTKKTA